MLSIRAYINHPEQVEIAGDENGLQELIDYLIQYTLQTLTGRSAVLRASNQKVRPIDVG